MDHSGPSSSTSLLKQDYPRAHGIELYPGGSGISQVRTLHTFSGWSVPVPGLCTEKFFFMSSVTSCASISACASSISGYHWRELSPCSNLSLQTHIDEVPSQLFLLKAEQPQPSAFLHKRDAPFLHHLYNLHWTHTRTSLSLLDWGVQNWVQYSRCTSPGLRGLQFCMKSSYSWVFSKVSCACPLLRHLTKLKQ